MSARGRYNLVLAIYPNTRGFGFALFEGALAPVDWGAVEMPGKDRNRRCVRRVSQLFGRYEPDALVLQDMSEQGTRRARRIRALNEAIEVLAETQGIPVFAYSRKQAYATFSDDGNLKSKYEIAEKIAKHIPAFEQFLPPVRKLWMSEDARMGIFDATALMLTFFEAVRAKQK